MNRQPVSSSSVCSVGYDPETQVLEIEFTKNHRVYQYHGVPQDVYESLMAAESVGSYLHWNIKGTYPHNEV